MHTDGPELLGRLNALWQLLNWKEICQKTPPSSIVAAGDVSKDFAWYEGGDIDSVFVMINRWPVWNAAIYALPYRIFTGWHGFELSNSSAGLEREAERLRPWLDYRLFVTIEGRREFRKKHAECSQASWKQVRKLRNPFFEKPETLE